MSSRDFYASLPVFTDFDEVTRPANFRAVPDDWHVLMSDVRDSTAAVRAGDYRHVNFLGAATITAILNLAGDTEVPFVFEGDGSMLCVPPHLLQCSQAALLHTRALAREAFGLDLRVATLAVDRIHAAGASVLVARYRVSAHYTQAVFAGGGLEYADRCMKDAQTGPDCAVDASTVIAEGSFEGLECRWQDVPSRHGETVCVMVRALLPEPAAAAALYRELIAAIHAIYGSDDASHPISAGGLTLALDGHRLAAETRTRAAGTGVVARWLYLQKLRLRVLLGRTFMRFGMRTGETDWGGYKATLVRNSDVRKFKDLYRQILAGSSGQREALTDWLETRYRRGELAYGIHVTDRAHITCLVSDYAGRHLHFVDGADGGLFLAASDFKRRLCGVPPPAAG